MKYDAGNINSVLVPYPVSTANFPVQCLSAGTVYREFNFNVTENKAPFYGQLFSVFALMLNRFIEACLNFKGDYYLSSGHIFWV